MCFSLLITYLQLLQHLELKHNLLLMLMAITSSLMIPYSFQSINFHNWHNLQIKH
ncbi:hypothetical protein Peur_042173 [Populus x canadensis]